MNKNDFKNPLVQSGAVLLAVFFLISIVAGSGSQGLGSSIGALFSGIFSAIIFLIALIIAISVSIAIMIGLYIAAVSIYSVDKGRDLFEQLKIALCNLYTKIIGSTKNFSIRSKPQSTESEAVPVTATPSVKPATVRVDGQLTALTEKIQSFETKYDELNQVMLANAAEIQGLRQRVESLADTTELNDKFAALEDSQKTIDSQLAEVSDTFKTTSTSLQNLEQKLSADQQSIREELASLHDKTAVPETISGILSYIDLQEDRELITEKATEAVARGMTYSQIDDYFKSSLAPGIYKELSAHPRLTKDFLRAIKKKF